MKDIKKADTVSKYFFNIFTFFSLFFLNSLTSYAGDSIIEYQQFCITPFEGEAELLEDLHAGNPIDMEENHFFQNLQSYLERSLSSLKSYKNYTEQFAALLIELIIWEELEDELINQMASSSEALSVHHHVGGSVHQDIWNQIAKYLSPKIAFHLAGIREQIKEQYNTNVIRRLTHQFHHAKFICDSSGLYDYQKNKKLIASTNYGFAVLQLRSYYYRFSGPYSELLHEVSHALQKKAPEDHWKSIIKRLKVPNLEKLGIDIEAQSLIKSQIRIIENILSDSV